MNREKLINHYEINLEKVKAIHNPNNYTSELTKDICNAYIEQAEKDLQEVINGREW